MGCHGVDYSGRRYANEEETFYLDVATMVVDLAIPLPPIYTAVKGSSVGARGSTVLYRAASEAEAVSVRATGKFSAGPNSLGGKWFAETLEQAERWGDLLNGRGASRILEVRLPNSTADQLMRLERLDGIGSARFGELGQLEQAIIRELP